MQAAVIGSGFIGPVHVEALRRAGIAVIGILDVDPERTQRAARQLRIETPYTGIDQLLDDDRVQAVHIAVPNRFHFDFAVRALSAGKHVMCEKPWAMNSRESAELVRLAGKSGVVAAVNYNIRYYPVCVEAAERMRDGRSGHLFHVSGSYVQDWLFHDTDFNWRLLAEEGGPLRAVADIGTHWLDLIHAITGAEVESVCADLFTVFPTRQRPLGEVETFSGKPGGGTPEVVTVGIDTEDSGSVLMRFRGGARGNLHVSQVTAGRKNCLRFEIASSNEAMAWDSETPNQLWIGHRDDPNQWLVKDPSLLSPRAAQFSHYPGGHNEGFPDTFKQCFLEFYQYIEQGDFSAPRRFPTFEDGHREVVLCEAILRSHLERRWINVEG